MSLQFVATSRSAPISTTKRQLLVERESENFEGSLTRRARYHATATTHLMPTKFAFTLAGETVARVRQLLVAVGLVIGAVAACAGEPTTRAVADERNGSRQDATGDIDHDETASAAGKQNGGFNTGGEANDDSGGGKVGGPVAGEDSDGRHAVNSGGASGSPESDDGGNGSGGAGDGGEATIEELCNYICPEEQYYVGLNAICGTNFTGPDREECLAYCLSEAPAYFPPVCRNEAVLYYQCEISVPYWRCLENNPGLTDSSSCRPQSNAMNFCLEANQ